MTSPDRFVWRAGEVVAFYAPSKQRHHRVHHAGEHAELLDPAAPEKGWRWVPDDPVPMDTAESVQSDG